MSDELRKAAESMLSVALKSAGMANTPSSWNRFCEELYEAAELLRTALSAPSESEKAVGFIGPDGKGSATGANACYPTLSAPSPSIDERSAVIERLQVESQQITDRFLSALANCNNLHQQVAALQGQLKELETSNKLLKDEVERLRELYEHDRYDNYRK